MARLDDQRVVSASYDNTLRVWDLDSGKTLAVFALDAPALSVAVTADGRGIVAGDVVGGVHFLDLDLSCCPSTISRAEGQALSLRANTARPRRAAGVTSSGR